MYLLGSNLLFGTLLCLVPSGSLNVFLFFMAVTLIELGITFVWWRKGMELVRFNSLTSFLLCITMGIFMVTPLFRIMLDTVLFMVILVVYLLLLLYALFKKEVIFQAFDKPGKSKIAKGTIIVLVVLIVLGALSFRYGQEMVIMSNLNDQQGGLFVASFLYVLGLLITFVSTALLKKPKEEIR